MCKVKIPGNVPHADKVCIEQEILREAFFSPRPTASREMDSHNDEKPEVVEDIAPPSPARNSLD